MHHHRHRLPPLFWLVGLLLAELTAVATFAGAIDPDRELLKLAALTPLVGVVAAPVVHQLAFRRSW